MGNVLARISNITQANLGDLLDKAENPPKLLRHFLNQAHDAEGRVRETLIEAKASLILMTDASETHLAQAKGLSLPAKKAVDAGRDDDARKHINKQVILEHIGEQWKSQRQQQEALVSKLTIVYDRIHERVQECEACYSLIVSRHESAKAIIRAERLLQGIGKSFNSLGDFNRMEGKVKSLEAKAQVLVDMAPDEVNIRQSEREQEVERRLEALIRSVRNAAAGN